MKALWMSWSGVAVESALSQAVGDFIVMALMWSKSGEQASGLAPARLYRGLTMDRLSERREITPFPPSRPSVRRALSGLGAVHAVRRTRRGERQREPQVRNPAAGRGRNPARHGPRRGRRGWRRGRSRPALGRAPA